jgi:hypothetical protein
MSDYIKQMECDHTYLNLRLPQGASHDREMEYGDFCMNCNARLDGIH